MRTEHRKVDLRSLLLGALAGASIMLSVAAVTNSDNSTAWEYKVVVGSNGMRGHDLQEGLNQAGAAGWELVTTSSYSEGMPLAVLKREKK